MSTPSDPTHDRTLDAALGEPEPALDAAFVQATAELIAHAQTNDALAHTLRQLAQALLAALPAANVADSDETCGQARVQPTVVQQQAGNNQAADAGVDISTDDVSTDNVSTDNDGSDDDGKDNDGKDNDGSDDALVVEPASAADIDHLLDRFGSQPAEAVSADEPADEMAYDPQRMASHLRLKARACRWLEHHALTDDPVALDERHALISEAKANDCLLWMFNRDYVNPQNPQLADVADLLLLTADVVMLWEDGYDEPEGRAIAQLVAAVQSALRLAVTAVNAQDNWFDNDQKAVYQELKYYGEREQHYLQHMRLNDGADPAKSGDYRQQYNALHAAIKNRRDADRQRQSQRNKLRFHVSKLLERPHNANHQWQSVLASLEPFWQGDDDTPHLPADISDDVRPLLALQDEAVLDDEERDYLETISAVFEDEIRAANLKALLDAAPIPDDAPETLGEKISGDKTPDDTAISDTAISDEVRRLEPHFAGRTVVIIGGDPKPHNSAALEQHFNCRVDWIKTTAHQSIYSFAPKLIRDDVVIVALLIRWSSHVFGEVKSLCDEHDKYLVRLPRGYGVNMFAHEVLAQIGERLSA